MDYFKEINDQFGHATGDKVLASVGNLIRKKLRSSDLACRLGGDEFIFFLPKTSSEQAWKFSERMHKALKEIEKYSDIPIQCTASMGLASYPEIETRDIEELYKAADKALYRAKENGRNQTRIFSGEEHGDFERIIVTSQQ